MKFLMLEMWAIWCGLGLMLLAAIVNARTMKVPNRLSLPSLVIGWLVAVVVSCSVGVPSNGGGMLPSLTSTILALILMVPFYLTGALGAGCVKMQMAFGAWVGCALSVGSAAWITATGTVAGCVVTVLASIMVLGLRKLKGGTDENKPKWMRFPAQITLSIGSAIGTIAASTFGWVQ